MKGNSINRAAQVILNAALADGHEEALELLTIKGACELAMVSRWTVARWLRLKDDDGNYIIRWHKLGKSRTALVRIDKASFLAFLESQEQYAENAPINSNGEEVNHVQPNR